MPSKRTRAVDHQYLIRAPPQKVFEAISRPAGLKRWLCDRAKLDPRTGGRYTLGWRNGPTHTGRIVEFVPGRSVTFEWAWEGIPVRGTLFQLTVSPRGRGTELHVGHTGFPRDPRWVDLYAGAEWGWTYFAMNLKSVLETGHDLRAPIDG